MRVYRQPSRQQVSGSALFVCHPSGSARLRPSPYGSHWFSNQPVLIVCALIIAIAWAIFPFVVVGKMNKILEAMEEIKETLVWQKTSDDPAAPEEDPKAPLR